MSNQGSLFLQLPDPSGARQPVHHRHLKIHENNVDSLASWFIPPQIRTLQEVECFLTMVCDVNGASSLLKLFTKDLF